MKMRSLLLFGAVMIALVLGISLLTEQAGADRSRVVSAGEIDTVETVTAFARPGNYFAAVQLTTAAADTFVSEIATATVWVSMNGSEWDSVAILADTVTAAAGTTVSTENEYFTIPLAPIVQVRGVTCNGDSLSIYPLLLEVEHD